MTFSFGKQIQRKYKYQVCNIDETDRYFSIMFQGRYVYENGKKLYSWRLRKELKEALQEMELEQEFMQWVGKKVKPATAKQYVSYLKNYPAKLENTENQLVDVFVISKVNDFEEIILQFEQDPNYKDLNEKYHNAFSAALGNYKNFLQDRMSTSTTKKLEQEYRGFLINRKENFQSTNLYVAALHRGFREFAKNEILKNTDIFEIDNIHKFNIIKQLVESDEELLNKVKKIQLQFIPALNRYNEFLSQRNQKNDKSMQKKSELSKNTILYGPPGTGKTYSTIIHAVAIIDERPLEEVKEQAKTDYETLFHRFKELQKKKQIETITFHQSYGYEEFIEGIKPIMEDEDNLANLQYKKEDGVFKAFCTEAQETVIVEGNSAKIRPSPTIWKVSLGGTGENPIRTDCFNNGYIRIGFDEYGEHISDETVIERGKNVINAFISKMQPGDILLSCFSNTTIDAIGIVTGEYEWREDFSEYKRIRKVDWIVKDIKKNILEINANKVMTLSTVYKLSISLNDIMAIINDHSSIPSQIHANNKKYVFIIDEINRGNISKVFGELITLIEDTKRIGAKEEAKINLPYSHTLFGVPDNVYLLGTMNTADRSIARLDTALRRRFHFTEMLPDPSVLEGIIVDGLNIREMFTRMNKKIELLYDREHTIGHSYFIALKNNENANIEHLSYIFRHKIIPLLQEYFYDDYEKIALVLGCNKTEDKEFQLISKSNLQENDLFGDYSFEYQDCYEINMPAFDKIESYRLI